MGATSVTGKGIGASNKITTKEMSALANGPDILVAGRMVIETIGSPPTAGANTVRFNRVLPGSPDIYTVILTGIGIQPYLADFIDDDAGDFVGFIAAAEDDGEAMYIVVKNGQKPVA